MHERSRGGVVEADERHVLRHTETSLLSGEEYTGSHIVAGGEDGCRPVRKREELLWHAEPPVTRKSP